MTRVRQNSQAHTHAGYILNSHFVLISSCLEPKWLWALNYRAKMAVYLSQYTLLKVKALTSVTKVSSVATLAVAEGVTRV